jgi:hypothetical protein
MGLEGRIRRRKERREYECKQHVWEGGVREYWKRSKRV